MTGKDGQPIGQVKYGYRPQYIFDSVNEFLGPENWRHELSKEEIFDTQAVAEVKLFLKVDGEWICKGSQKGQMQIVKGNVGDAQKGAITDALQKCMSLLSIGSDSYKGLLKHVYQQNSRKPQDNKKQAPEKPVEPNSNPTAMPKIAGVTFEDRQGVIVAIGDKLFDPPEHDLVNLLRFRRGHMAEDIVATAFTAAGFTNFTRQVEARYAGDGVPRRRTGGRKSSVQLCCTRDEGRPLEAAVQAEASNRPLLLRLRDVVVSELGKGLAQRDQVRTVESNESEPLLTCRKRRDDVETGGSRYPGISLGGA